MNLYNLNRRQFLLVALSLPSCLLSKKFRIDSLLEINHSRIELLMLQQAIPKQSRNQIKQLTANSFSNNPELIDSLHCWWRSIVFSEGTSIFNIRNIMEDKIKDSFHKRQTQFINGWLISSTEIKLSMLANLYF